MHEELETKMEELSSAKDEAEQEQQKASDALTSAQSAQAQMAARAQSEDAAEAEAARKAAEEAAVAEAEAAAEAERAAAEAAAAEAFLDSPELMEADAHAADGKDAVGGGMEPPELVFELDEPTFAPTYRTWTVEYTDGTSKVFEA